MLFASQALAARIERAECGLLAAGAESARRRRGVDWFVEPLAGGLAVCGAAGSPLNKVAGLGFGGPIASEGLDAVETAFAARGIPVQVELSTLAEPSIAAALMRRGYALNGFENVLGRPLPLARSVEAGGSVEAASGIDVRRCDEAEIEQWIDVVVAAFAAADDQGVPSHESFARSDLEDAMRDVAGAAGVVTYLARRDGAVAGGASMRLADGIAELRGAGTLPEHRRRGVQTAMLYARLAAAGAAGCDLATLTALPGSKSHENAQRQGFELLYSRAILVRAP